MQVRDLVYNFKLKADKRDSKNAANLKLPAIIFLLNEGMSSLLIKKYSGKNTPLRAAIEEIQKRRDEFQRLIVPNETLIATAGVDNWYLSDLTKTKKPYLFLLRCNMNASKGSCKNRRLKGVIAETDDLDLIEDSTMEDSSFEWGDCRYRLAEDKIQMLSDGTFKINSAKIDYLRYPKPIDVEGYKKADGTLSTDSECELPDFLHYAVIDEALVVYASSFNSADMQAKIAKLMLEE